MEEKHWPLVILTLFCQAAVGLLLFHVTLGSYLEAGHLGSLVEILSLGLAGCALILSSLHLGCPGNGYNAIRNIAGSWLSREALALIIFIGCLTAQVVCGLADYQLHLEIPALFIGLFLIYAMARVYDLSAVPTWQRAQVMKDFFMSTILLGGFTYCLLLAIIAETTSLIFIFLATLLAVRIFQSLSQSRRQSLLVAATIVSWLLSFVALPSVFLLVSLSLIFSREYLARSAFYHAYKRGGV